MFNTSITSCKWKFVSEYMFRKQFPFGQRAGLLIAFVLLTSVILGFHAKNIYIHNRLTCDLKK